jgi:4-amino-4-deoxy-L-arabinose transferase-like glycosyltransferase
VSFRGFCFFLGALAPVYMLLAAYLPPFDDELYYWCWSCDLQLSYYDHPPMVAYMIRIATELFGNSIFAIRLPAVLSALVVAFTIGWLSRPRLLLPVILLSPVLMFAAVLVTPDTPLMLFWALYLIWLVEVHERLAESEELHSALPGWRLWMLGGLILGCGVLGKYTTGLAAIAGGVSFLYAGNFRKWSAGYVLHAFVAMLVATPILIHNIQHDFIPLRYQWEHSMSSPEPGFASFGEFLVLQFLLVGTVPLTVFIWALAHRKELLVDPRLRVCTCLFVVPFAFFLFKATRGRLQGNWAFPIYIACWPVVVEWYSRARESTGWRWATRAGFAPAVGTCMFFVINLIEPMPVLPALQDRVSRQWERMAIARAISDDLDAIGYKGPVYAQSYQWTAVLRWHGIDARQLDETSRPSHFTEQGYPPLSEVHGFVFTEAPVRPVMLVGLGQPRSAVCYPLIVRGVEHPACWILDYCYSGDTNLHASTTPARLDQNPPHASP